MSSLARKAAVKYLVGEGRCSERQACLVVGMSRSVVRYVVRKREDEGKLVREIHQLAVRHG